MISKSSKYTRNALTLLTISTISWVLLLSGCQSTPSKDDNNLQTAEAWLQKARFSLSPEREQFQINAARQLSEENKPLKAMALLDGIDRRALTAELITQYVMLFSELALADDAYYLTQRILSIPELESKWRHIKNNDAIVLRERKAQVLFLLAEPVASLRERMQLNQLLTNPEAITRNQEAIWQTLLSIPVSGQRDLLLGEQDRQLKGWLELASSVRYNQDDIELQLQAVDQWVARWPEHPASLRLPTDLQQLRYIVDNRPKKVAILLPTSGKLAKPATAIRDGLMAAHYAALDAGRFTPSLFFLDSASLPLNQLYQQAAGWGAEIVIGPLSKEKLSELAQLDELLVPTLALNYNTEITEAASNLYQFGIATEDEAKQVAQQAWIEGHRNALVIYPETSWGERSRRAFSDEWEKLGGQVVAQGPFKGGSNYSRTVENLLHTRSSKQRSYNLRGIIGEKFEFEPRRRKDIDVIFMAARPQEGRQLKPTFSFHYAAGIPVYSTSQVYSGVSDRSKDRDLNGIRFTALPWFFARNNPIKQAMSENLTLKPGYGQLYALGIDAYHIYPRLPQLETMANSRHFGLTGTLRLDQISKRINRQAQWATIKGGRAKAEDFISNSSL